MKRKYEELKIPKEVYQDIQDMQGLERVIKTFPDQLYEDQGLDRSKLEIRQLKTLYDLTYLGEWNTLTDEKEGFGVLIWQTTGAKFQCFYKDG